MKKTILLLIAILTISPLSYSAVIDTNHVFGLTLDAVNGLARIDTALARLCKKPTTRIVFDEWVAATDYVQAVNEIKKYSFVMGELLDSYYVSQYTTAQYTARAFEYLNTLGTKVDIWEIGNEINGEWLGTTSDVVIKMDTAYKIFKAAGKKTALTLYYNKDCYSNAKNEMFYWVNKNVKQELRNGLDYVWISYYEDDCNNYQPDWQRVFDSLHVLFPNSKIGIGECGTLTASNKAEFINRYYRMNITTPNYVGGYFWWYFKQDCVPYTNALWTTFNNAISNFAPPATQSTNITYFRLGETSVSLSWINGSGTKRAVFMKDGTGTTPALQNGFTYTASSVFGKGMSDGNGWFCVYNGSALSNASGLVITELQPAHNYTAMVVEYNGFSGYEGYNLNTSTNNPILVQGFLPVELSSFNFSVTSNTVTLKWITAFEVNNSGFNIERRDKESEVWTNAGFVKGKGSSSVPVSYSFEDKNLKAGKYIYRLRQVDYNGSFTYYSLNGEPSVGIPVKFELSQNYPNPFNPVTRIDFSIPLDSRASLKIYDITGKEIKTLFNEYKQAGYYEITYDASSLTSGIYFYNLKTDYAAETKKMLLLK